MHWGGGGAGLAKLLGVGISTLRSPTPLDNKSLWRD